MYNDLVKRLREHNGWALNETLDKAADAIEELQSDNASLNGTVSNLIQQIAELNKTRWIPVTERLPEGNDVYLVCAYREVTEMNYWHGRWHRRGDDYTKAVTHWMPLPEPPKEVDA